MSGTAFFTSGRSLGLLWLLSGITASGCALNPATGSNQLMLVTEDQEIAMGRQADTAVIATIGLYPDAAWQSYIQQFGARLAATTERPNPPGRSGWSTTRQ
jgi:predicted Zn-dependent protease